MARIRTVKPDYYKHRKVRAVSRNARLLNIGLWNLADDEGRLQELPNSIIGELFPTDDDITTVLLREWLRELSDQGLIERYEVDGEAYIQCHDFNDHQVINKPKKSNLPPPPTEPKKRGSKKNTVRLRDAYRGEGNGREKEKEGKGRELNAAVAAQDAPLSHLLADLVASNDPNGVRPTVTQRWADAERLMLEKDGRGYNEANRLIAWTQADEFWRGNVQSMPKFREKYGQLYQAAVRSTKQKAATNGKSTGGGRAAQLAAEAMEAEARGE